MSHGFIVAGFTLFIKISFSAVILAFILKSRRGIMNATETYLLVNE